MDRAHDAGRDRDTIRWLWAIPGRKKLYIAWLTILESVQGASGVLYALLLHGVVDAAAGGDGPQFRRYLALTALLAAGQLLLRAAVRRLSELTRAAFENAFKKRLLHTLLHRDYLTVSAVHSGEWMNRLTSDTAVVAHGYAEIVPGLAGMAVKLISALTMILVLEPRFAAILLPAGAALAVLTWLFRRVLKRLHKAVQEADGRLRMFLQDRIGSLLMIRSFAAERQTEAAGEEKMQAHQAARMRRTRFSNLCSMGFGAAMNGMYLFGVGWCARGILLGTVSFGTLTAVTQLISQIQMPFANITGYLPRYYVMLASAERLREAERFPEDAGEAEDVAAAVRFYRDELAAFGLRDASFAYCPPSDGTAVPGKDGMPAALRDLTLEVKKGEYVAFTGHSGCGKSTALKLLMCVYRPDSGERYYRDSSGREGELTAAWRRLFAYVPQGNQLMSGTIREIVSFADPAAARDEARLSQALRIACAEEFVAELEQGADTLLGERGTGLSEGQMQRLAIARAVFSGSPVLLLDEATSALDTQTERQLLENLRSMTDKTVIIVTHRPAALEICDRVLPFTPGGGGRAPACTARPGDAAGGTART